MSSLHEEELQIPQGVLRGNNMRKITVAATQMACSWDRTANIDRAEVLIRKAAEEGAQIIQLLFYPTAIGSFAVPVDQIGKTYEEEKWIIHWQNAMLGHAAANMAPVIASNRIGIEEEPKAGTAIRFWGSSFIGDNTGVKVAEMDEETEGVITAEFDMDDLEAYRREVCVFRDRRPSMYRDLLTLEGKPVE